MAYTNNLKTNSILFYRGKRLTSFFTEDSKLYIAPKEQLMAENGIVLERSAKKFDSASSRILKNYRQYRSQSQDLLYRLFVRYYRSLRKRIAAKPKLALNQWSMVKLWNLSIVGAILLGMVSITLIYKLLGPGALAGKEARVIQNSEIVENQGAQVLGAASEDKEDGVNYIEKIVVDFEAEKKEKLEEEIRSMVKGYPIEKMVPYIVKHDRIVAAFLVGIAKKESNWGRRVPVLNGHDCYNYWGYTAKRKLMGTGGHTCFNSRQDAVDTVAKRIKWLIDNRRLDTPAKMVIWKCGSECHKDNQAAVRKWISDVSLYFEKLNE